MDLIDRQAAIDALQKEINKGIPPFDDVMGSIRCGVRLARNIIEDLPSAEQNLQPTCNQLATDCISRKEAIDAIDCNIVITGRKNAELVAETIAMFADRIKSLPSAEPVIRCKDCKHYNAGYECLIEGYGIERDKDWFCADGERRDDE